MSSIDLTRPRVRVALAAAVALGPLLLGPVACTPAEYARQADDQVLGILADTDHETLADRADWVVRPEAASAELQAEEDGPIDPLTAPDVGAGQAGLLHGGEPEPRLEVELDLDGSLAQAFRTAREYLTRADTLFLQGVNLSRVRFNFGPQIDATLDALYTDREDGDDTRTGGADFSVSQILDTGGTFSVLGSAAGSALFRGDTIYDTNIDFSLSQPLLQGAGYEPSHEPLTQAERDIVYEVRDFELFREDFSISIAQDYYSLVSQLTQLANEEENYEFAKWDREKSEALRRTERVDDEAVFLAQRRLIDAENRLLIARVDLETDLDRFRIRLGMPDNVKLSVLKEDPPYRPVRLDADSAVRTALHNRIDLMTAKSQVEDTERRVRVAANGLLPQLDLDLGYGLTGRDESLSDSTPDSWDVRAGLSLEIPIQRTPERNVYRAALIAYEREARDYQLLLENTEQDVRVALRELRRTEQQIVLAETRIQQEQRAVAVVEIRYERGDAENRDLLDARQSLVDAQNALIDLQVSHFIGRLRLYRDLGLLFIDPDGMWRL